MSSNRCSLQKCKIDSMEKSNGGSNTEQMIGSGTWHVESTPSNKPAVHPYSAAVAQRALFGSNRRRSCGRRVGNKDSKLVPCRLSKVSLAEDMDG